MNLKDYSTKELENIMSLLNSDDVKDLIKTLNTEIESRKETEKVNSYNKAIGNTYVKTENTENGAKMTTSYYIVSYDKKTNKYVADITTIYERNEKNNENEEYVYSKRKESNKYVDIKDIENCEKKEKYNKSKCDFPKKYHDDYKYSMNRFNKLINEDDFFKNILKF